MNRKRGCPAFIGNVVHHDCGNQIIALDVTADSPFHDQGGSLEFQFRSRQVPFLYKLVEVFPIKNNYLGRALKVVAQHQSQSLGRTFQRCPELLTRDPKQADVAAFLLGDACLCYRDFDLGGYMGR